MKGVFKSKVGMAMSCVYVLLLIAAVLEAFGSKPEPMDSLGLLILTAPWSFFLGILMSSLGVITLENGDSFVLLLVAFGGAINIVILLLIGRLITKLFQYFTTPKKELS